MQLPPRERENPSVKAKIWCAFSNNQSTTAIPPLTTVSANLLMYLRSRTDTLIQLLLSRLAPFLCSIFLPVMLLDSGTTKGRSGIKLIVAWLRGQHFAAAPSTRYFRTSVEKAMAMFLSLVDLLFEQPTGMIGCRIDASNTCRKED